MSALDAYDFFAHLTVFSLFQTTIDLMKIGVLIGRTIAALIMAAILGVITVLALEHLAPQAPLAFLPISGVSLSGGTLTAGLGAFLGWRYAEEVADGLIFELLGRLVFGAVALLFRAF